MKRYIVLLVCLGAAVYPAWAAQSAADKGPAAAGKKPAGTKDSRPSALSPQEEERLLWEAVAQAGDSPVNFIRAAERYLSKYPHSSLREGIERAIVKAAIDARDNRRIVVYGEKVLEREDNPALLDRVARALLTSDDAEAARRSMKYSKKLEELARKMRSNGPGRWFCRRAPGATPASLTRPSWCSTFGPPGAGPAGFSTP